MAAIDQPSTPRRQLDLEAIARELRDCAGEIEARIAEIEAGQRVTGETMRLEFG